MKKAGLLISVLYASVSMAQVNLQTGAATAGFPLYQYADAKSRLTTGVSLAYTAGNGLKMNQLASSVGTGWTLQAAGVITRVQHGEPDDQQYSGPSEFRETIGYNIHDFILDTYYPAGYMYSSVSVSDPLPANACQVPMFPDHAYNYKALYDDREQDVYEFQFNGRAGQFVIGKNLQPQILDDSKLAISFTEEDMTSQLIRTRISSFTITDETGIKYKFSEKEINDVLKYTYNSTQNGYTVYTGQELFGSTNPKKIITKWFLTEIVNPFTDEKIVFDYDSYSIDVQGTSHLSKQFIDNDDDDVVTWEWLTERMKMTTQRLVSITMPDLYKVQFNYASADRLDLPGDKALTEINVLYNNALVYGYRLNYGYFLKDQVKAFNYVLQPTDKQRFARLCLLNFNKVGYDGSSLPSYKFTYNIDEGYYIPPVFTLYSDHWGFYNRNTNVIGESDDGIPGTGFGVKTFSTGTPWPRNGILQKIEYPEGGSLEFEYEINQAEASIYSGKEVGGVRVKRTILYDGNSHTNDIKKQYKYINSDNTSSGWGFESPVYTESKVMRQYPPPSGWTTGQHARDIASDFIAKCFYNQFANIAFTSALNVVTSAIYQSIVIFVIDQIINIFFTDDYKEYTVQITRSDNINLGNPLPLQYSRIEVLDEGGGNGKVVYEFTSDQFQALRVPGPLTLPYSGAKQRFAPWLYGLPLKVTWYNSASTPAPVRKVENLYNPIVRELNTPNFISKSWAVNKDVITRLDDPEGLSTSNVTSESFYPIQGRIELTKTTETVYNSNGESAATETSFTYSPNNFLVRTVSKKDSKGAFTGSTTYYVNDYNIAGAINDMKSYNMVNLPVSVNSWVKGPLTTDNEKLTGASVTEYAQLLSTGDYKPYQLYRAELTAPLENTVADVDNFSATDLLSYSYLKPQAAMFYSQGNVTQQTAINGNKSNSVVYDYDQRFVVAEADNAASNEIQYTSFEADGTGGFTFNPAGIVTDYSPTGKKCFNLNTGDITSGITGITKPVIISLWTTGSTIQVNRARTLSPTLHFNPVKTGPVINGWKYCEFEIAVPTDEIGTLSFTISGNGLVDELRWYPANARMSTCTYSPGIGKTSECDVNNRIIYYEYDGLGRLIQVKDQYRNLVKAYEYNYKQ